MNNKTKFKKAWVIYPGVTIVIVIIVCIFWCWRIHPVTTVLIVRHAEKSATPSADPPLSPEGELRAQKLVHVAGVAGINAIFATEYLRTQQTVEPLAAHLGLTVNEMSATDIEGLVGQIKADYAGKIVIIAAHSNTVPQIIEELGGDLIEPIYENVYDNLFVVTIFRIGKPKVLNLRYGNPS